MKRYVLAVALWMATCASPDKLALADDDPDAKAQALFSEAVALMGKGKTDPRNYEEAVSKFLAAYRLVPSPNALFDAGLAEEKLGRATDAIRHFRKTLTNPSTDAKMASQAGKHIAALASRVATVYLEAPAGAEISIDGVLLDERAPLGDPIDLSPGKHTLSAQLYGSAAVEVDAVAGTTRSVRIDLAPPSAPTTTTVTSPASTQTPRSGTGRQVVPPVPAPPAPVPSSSFWITRRVLGIGFVGVGAASLVVSGIFAADSDSDKARANSIGSDLNRSACTGTSAPLACQAQESAYSAQNRDFMISQIGLGVGIVAVAAGAAMFLWPQSSSAVHAAILPFPVPRGGGVQFAGVL